MKAPAKRPHSPIFVLLALGSLLSSCVALHKEDAFPVASKPLDLVALQLQIGQDSQLRPLKVVVDGHPVAAYRVHHPSSGGVLIFFGGSGNQVEVSIRGLNKRTKELGLDLVVFSYYQEGEPVPSVAEVRAKTKAVYTAVRSLRTPETRAIYLLGHSLGGWFALDLAASEPVNGLALAGAETTPAEVIRRTDAPWASLVAIHPDGDARQLDASLYAPRIQTPTLVVTSRQDEAVPAAVGQELFGMLPPSTPKRLVILNGVSHGRYFLSDDFWQPFASFFGNQHRH